MKFYGFDHIVSIMDTSLIDNRFCPSDLKNHGFLEYLKTEYNVNANEIYEKLKNSHYPIYHNITSNWQVKLLSSSNEPQNTRRKFIVGANIGDGHRFIQPVRLQWRNSKPVLIYAGYQAQYPLVAGLENLYFNLATGGIHFLQGNLFSDEKLRIWPKLEWFNLYPLWKKYFEELRDNNVNPKGIFVDWEVKWNYEQCYQLGRDWLYAVKEDSRCGNLIDLLGFGIDDFFLWGKLSDKALRWTEINYKRTMFYQRLFSDAVWSVWPETKISYADSEYKCPTFYGTIRRSPIGEGGSAGNITSLKNYGVASAILPGQKSKTTYYDSWSYLCNEIRTIAGACATSKLPFQSWIQDNEDNAFLLGTFGQEMLRHILLLSKEPVIISCEGGVLRTDSSAIWGNIASEVDEMSGCMVGEPIVPDAFGENPWFLLSGMDVGSKILWRLTIRPDVASKVRLEQYGGNTKISLNEEDVIIPGARLIMKNMSMVGCWLESIK